MSYDDDDYGSVNSLERSALITALNSYREEGEEYAREAADIQRKIRNSERFKEASKRVAGLSNNRDIKFALMQKVHQECLDYAITRYMLKEALPKYYAVILKDQNCIDRLLEGIFYKVCKLAVSQPLTEKISSLSYSLRANAHFETSYDRVTYIQQFIHETVDEHFGLGTARSIPVLPMKNALSAARLNLAILDVSRKSAGYIEYIDSLSYASSMFEHIEPRQSTAPTGKRSWPRWRVRHLRPLSYYYPSDFRAILQSLRILDEEIAVSEFIQEALRLYAEAR